MIISEIEKLYCGFTIKEPVGNNAFSFDKRLHKSIYVTKLIIGNLKDLSKGNEIAFSEIEDGVEKNFPGLKNFIYYNKNEKDIFIFDNHNHAFFFWLAAYLQEKISPGSTLLHIDQHTDMRKPSKSFPFSLKEKFYLSNIFNYSNFTLNVGNFIQPALDLGLFKRVEIIDSSYSFETQFKGNFILDIDMDIFSDDMSYIPDEYKIKKIRNYIKHSSFITIASSPYFINQQKAIEYIYKIFE